MRIACPRLLWYNQTSRAGSRILTSDQPQCREAPYRKERFSVLGASSWQAVLPFIANGAILVYCLLPGTKQALGTG
jgi:hypothetical protein